MAHMQTLTLSMIERCSEDQDSNEFTRLLKDLLLSREIVIEGWPEVSGERKPVIGYLVPELRQLHLYPSMTFRAVMEMFRIHDLRSTERAIARQLQDEGILCDVDSGRHKKQVRHRGQRTYVWILDLDKMGINIESTLAAQTGTDPGIGKVLPFRPGYDMPPGEQLFE